ncbi:hypothetical protein WICPIJ_010073 [Wickerhamomyces pijperi]|uniref:Uncharacterized protein n=1 Tax=Wickerhamomyces pijperi TaxID=599730 RepID=A0A9P8PHR8_WICPI|nr:hypothetical protein WICPIJ_010073 [Wickerhamomyces pijperi]
MNQYILDVQLFLQQLLNLFDGSFNTNQLVTHTLNDVTLTTGSTTNELGSFGGQVRTVDTLIRGVLRDVTTVGNLVFVTGEQVDGLGWVLGLDEVDGFGDGLSVGTDLNVLDEEWSFSVGFEMFLDRVQHLLGFLLLKSLQFILHGLIELGELVLQFVLGDNGDVQLAQLDT